MELLCFIFYQKQKTLLRIHKKQKNEYNVLKSYVKYKIIEMKLKLKIFMMAIFLRHSQFFGHFHHGHSYKVYSYIKKRVSMIEF